jgi:hypothetical protein
MVSASTSAENFEILLQLRVDHARGENALRLSVESILH